MILSLDTSTNTGWAAGEPGATPTWGVRKFGAGKSTGEVVGAFRNWLNTTCYEIKPSLIVFEAPYVPRPQPFKKVGGPPPMNPLTLRRLLSLVGTVEAVAWELGIECLEATVPEISKFFLGNARQGGRAAKKAATIKMCRLYGWDTVSDDAADALALWCLAEHTIAPQIGSRRSASARLALPLHGTLLSPAPPEVFDSGKVRLGNSSITAEFPPQKSDAPQGPTTGRPIVRHRTIGENQCQTRLII